MAEFYDITFAKSQLHLRTNIHMGSHLVTPNLSYQGKINVLVVPNINDHIDEEFASLTPAFDSVIAKLRAMVLSVERRPITTNTGLTEKMWFSFVQKSWENVKNSSFFLEYSRLL